MGQIATLTRNISSLLSTTRPLKTIRGVSSNRKSLDLNPVSFQWYWERSVELSVTKQLFDKMKSNCFFIHVYFSEIRFYVIILRPAAFELPWQDELGIINCQEGSVWPSIVLHSIAQKVQCLSFDGIRSVEIQLILLTKINCTLTADSTKNIHKPVV